MRTLAVETSTRNASVVLADDDLELAAWREEAGRDLCRRLSAEIEQVLRAADSDFSRIGLVAVGLGPGSFTSMRVGLAAAKAIAAARDLPLVGVPSLEAAAWQVRDRAAGLVCPILDAGRGELYAAVCRVGATSVEEVEGAFLADARRLVERLLAQGESVTVLGGTDQAAASEIGAGLGEAGAVLPGQAVLPDALAVAQLGRRRYDERGGDDIASLRPIYVRMSYAEERFDIDLGLR